jgi:hypothetical protein
VSMIEGLASYHVYAVELDQSLCERRGCLARNGKPPIYVGQSFSTPEDRFKQHKAGYKASRFVRDYGVRLLPRLYKACGPYATREEAEDGEARLAARLRGKGFCVFGGH